MNAIVLDVGTYQVKAGYAGEDTPKFVFPSVSPQTRALPRPPPPPLTPLPSPQAVGVGGKPLSDGADKMDVDSSAGQYHVGTHALGLRRDGMEVTSPFTDGVLSDWDAVEALWDHALK